MTTDSRKIEHGAIFFALRGDNFDGNRYALAALDAGAAYAVVDDRSLAAADSRIIVVDDTLGSLQSLAREHRRELGIPIFALTGSNGKTTTKEFTRAALSTKFRHIGCTEGNFNNHIGVPLTILSFNRSTEIGIVEMGANHRGEIALLCSIAEPNVGLITNIGRAHLEGFGGSDGVRKGKGEMLDYLAKHCGTAIYNTDDKILCEMVAERGGSFRSVAYHGQGEEGAEIKLSLFGRYNQLNAAAALAVADYFGADKAAAALAISAYTPLNNRSQIIEQTPLNNRLIADCYNANPSSMEAAVVEFLSTDAQSKVLILGAMRELGDYSVAEHRRLKELAQKAERCYFVGSEFRSIVADDQLFLTAEELSAHLATQPIANKTILIKGSNSNHLEQLIEKL